MNSPTKRRFVDLRSWFWALVCYLVFCLLMGLDRPASARIAIAPTQVELKSDTGFGYITVSNQSMEPVQYRIRLPQEFSGSILVSPAVFSLEPTASRIVRFKLKSPEDLAQVLEKRVLLEQVLGKAAQGTIQIQMNFSLPIRAK